MTTSLIDGKHPKKIVIDYYDDLIAQVDIYAEELLETIKDDAIVNEPSLSHKKHLEDLDLDDQDELDKNYNNSYLYDPFERIYNDPYKCKYNFDVSPPLPPSQPPSRPRQTPLLVKDFVHSERMKAINLLKKFQKERLEELNKAIKRPSSVEEALFGNKFCILVEVGESNKKMKMIFRLVTVVVDFYVGKDQFKRIEALVSLGENKRSETREIEKNCGDIVNSISVQLLTRYLKAKLKNETTLNGISESIQLVSIKQLYAIESIYAQLLSNIEAVVINRSSINFENIKSLNLYIDQYDANGHRYARVQVNLIDLSGLPNLEFLSLNFFSIDLTDRCPFGFNEGVSKLRRLDLSDCEIKNSRSDFLMSLPNLESLYFSNTFNFNLLLSIPLNNLKYFSVDEYDYDYEDHEITALNFLNNLPNLVFFKFLSELKNWIFEEDTFRELNKLEVLHITDKCQKSGSRLINVTINLKYLQVDYLGEFRVDDFVVIEFVEQINRLTQLENLELQYCAHVTNIRSGSFRCLKNLKSLKLTCNSVEKIEENAFEGLEQLDNLIICYHQDAPDIFEFNHLLRMDSESSFSAFRCLSSSLRKLTIMYSLVVNIKDFSEYFPNLINLTLIFDIHIFDNLQLSYLKNLRKLRLVNFKARALPKYAFENLTKLTELAVGGNIRNLNERSFRGLASLRVLDLRGIELRREFNVNILVHMPRLKRIYLSRSENLNRDELREKLDSLDIQLII